MRLGRAREHKHRVSIQRDNGRHRFHMGDFILRSQVISTPTLLSEAIEQIAAFYDLQHLFEKVARRFVDGRGSEPGRRDPQPVVKLHADRFTVQCF